MDKNVKKSIEDKSLVINESEHELESLTVKSKEYYSPTPGEFPIIAQDIIPRNFLAALQDVNSTTNEEKDILSLCNYYQSQLMDICKLLKEAGFNCVISSLGHYLTNPVCKLLSNENINYIANIQGYVGGTPWDVSNGINKFGNNENLVGYEIKDEPEFNDWGDFQFALENPNEGYQNLPYNKVTFADGVVRALAPDKLSYFNLAVPEMKERPDSYHPIYWKFTGSCTSYRQYLDVLEMLFKPTLWSYDVYPFTEDSDTGLIKCLYDHFYESLDIFVNQSKKTGYPFWAYCLCEAYDRYSNGVLQHGRPVPTVAMIRFSVFSAVAAGAQGIVYWQVGEGEDGEVYKKMQAPYYCTLNPILLPNNTLVKYSCQVEKRTEIYDAVKMVNDELKSLVIGSGNNKNIFLGASFKEYGHVGTIYKNTPEAVFPMSFLADVEGDVMVSRFMNAGKEFYMIMSHNPWSSITVNVTFMRYVTIETVSVIGKVISKRNTVNGVIYEIELEASGYAIFKYSPATIQPII